MQLLTFTPRLECDPDFLSLRNVRQLNTQISVIISASYNVETNFRLGGGGRGEGAVT